MSGYLKIQSPGTGSDFEACPIMREVYGNRATNSVPDESDAGQLHIVEAARNFMHGNFSAKIRVEQIAKKAFVSQYHFSRIFKRHTRYSPYQYLLNLRLEHARMLMEKTELSIKEVTFRAGFSSLDYFSAAFTRKYKLCPSAYRKTVF